MLFRSLSAAQHWEVRRLEALAVKGKAEAVDVHELMWQHTGARTLVPGRAGTLWKLSEPRLRLVYNGKEILFRVTLTLGRDATNDIVIIGPMVSRQHARIEQRQDKFALIDQSANGTYLTIAGRQEIVLRREEFILYGSGLITLGDSPRHDPVSGSVEFHYESMDDASQAGR